MSATSEVLSLKLDMIGPLRAAAPPPLSRHVSTRCMLSASWYVVMPLTDESIATSPSISSTRTSRMSFERSSPSASRAATCRRSAPQACYHDPIRR
jgi:hypothetical protein